MVSKPRSVDIELPAGPHTQRTGFMSTAKGPACAVRLRQPEPPEPSADRSARRPAQSGISHSMAGLFYLTLGREFGIVILLVEVK